MKTDNHYTRGVIATILAAVVWSTAGVLVKLIPHDAFTILFYRSLYAGILFLCVFNKEAIQFSQRALLISVFYAPLLICFVTATKLTTAANAIFLQYISPAIVLLIEPRLLGVRMKRYNILTVVACLIGMSFLLIEQKPTQHHWVGDGIALLSGFFAAGLVLALRFSTRGEQVTGITIGNMWIVLVTLPWFLQSPTKTADEHLMLAYLGFIQIGVGYLLFTYGQRRIPALEGSLITMLEPMLNPIWVLIWYGETPSAWSITGGIVIIAALIIRMIYISQYKPGLNLQAEEKS